MKSILAVYDKNCGQVTDERQVYKMSNENWNEEETNDQFSEAGEQNIVDGTAEVISETPGAERPAYEETGSPVQDYAYEYDREESGGNSSENYVSADTASATGNGSYQYGGTSHEYYQGENYGSSVGGGTGSGSGGSSGGRGKGFLAVVLAIVFGVCIGAGAWGVHHYLGNSSASADAVVADAGENKNAAVDGEKNEEQVTEEPQAEADDQAQPEETQPAQKEPAQEEQEQTQAAENTADADTAVTKNEAGLVIADTPTPDTEITKVVNQVMPSIVSVYNNFTQEVQTFYGETFTQEGESTGSGIIIGKTDNELLIVTNNHVVEGTDNLRVLFIDQETCDAEIKGTDPSNDLAVIAVPIANIKDTTLQQIKVATLGNSDSLKIGETVIAIGNALGYGQSVTTGIISANNREINDNTITGTFIQTDAAINPGNSGGALVNVNGNVIGINSSKIGGDAVEGMGFAIPISRAIPIIEGLMSRETLSKVDENERGAIGISGATVTSDVAAAYGMPQGIYVAGIIENGGAANSDLSKGDIITAINDQAVSTMEELQKQLEYYKAGTEVTLTVQRQDGNGEYKEVKVNVTLGSRDTIQNQEQDGQQQGGQQQDGQQQGGQQQGGQGRQESQEGSESANPFYGFGFPFEN